MQIIIDPEYDIAQNLNLELIAYFKKGSIVVGSSNIQNRYDYKLNENWFGSNLDTIVINGVEKKYPINTNVWIGGTYHRYNAPAFVDFILKKEQWIVNGKYHRDDGPAIVDNEYFEYAWYINGKRQSRDKELILNSWWKTKNGL